MSIKHVKQHKEDLRVREWEWTDNFWWSSIETWSMQPRSAQKRAQENVNMEKSHCHNSGRQAIGPDRSPASIKQTHCCSWRKGKGGAPDGFIHWGPAAAACRLSVGSSLSPVCRQQQPVCQQQPVSKQQPVSEQQPVCQQRVSEQQLVNSAACQCSAACKFSSLLAFGRIGLPEYLYFTPNPEKPFN